MHQAPSRGARDGIKKDLQKVKEGEYNPNGVGNAYSHNFLNQKPWHPANFKNQARVFEAQQAKLADEKRKQQAKSDFEAEQEYLQTLSYLGPDEEQKYRERQGVQFLYMKPPGVNDDPLPKPQVKPIEKENQGKAPEGVQTGVESRKRPWQEARQSHVGDMLGAMRALQEHDKWTVKHVTGVGHSPPRGDSKTDNHQFVMSSQESDSVSPDEDAGELNCREQERERLEAAKEVLRRANIDAGKVKASKSKKRHKDKKKSSHKSTKRKRRKEESS